MVWLLWCKALGVRLWCSWMGMRAKRAQIPSFAKSAARDDKQPRKWWVLLGIAAAREETVVVSRLGLGQSGNCPNQLLRPFWRGILKCVRGTW